MKRSEIPKTRSIKKFGAFWDTHDLTDFEADLVEVRTPIFEREKAGKRTAVNAARNRPVPNG
jgi:hypothetical protein